MKQIMMGCRDCRLLQRKKYVRQNEKQKCELCGGTNLEEVEITI